jgi:hypothetical protein
MKKMWHPYWNWEDWKAGMWAKVALSKERELLPLAVEFTGNADLYGSYMVRVTNEWQVSCEHNLTDKSLNKKAWIGHAACALAHGLPEYIVRKAWGMLTEKQRIDANLKAENAILIWTKSYRGNHYGWQLDFGF